MDYSNPPAKRAKIVHGNFITEDGVMKFDFMTSLQNIAMAKVVTDLWMDRNNLEAIREFVHSCPSDSSYKRKVSNVWKEIENNVVAKISNSFLPKSVISELTDLVPFTGLSMLNWIVYNDTLVLNSDENSKYSAVDHVSSLTWTARGNIDYAETARNMLADGDAPLSKDHKYKIACAYCLEDEIAVLAADVVDSCYFDGVEIDMHPMVCYWTAHVTGDDKLLPKILNSYYCYRRSVNNVSINEEIFRFLILIGGRWGCSKGFNEVAINHMWNRLSTEEKERNLKPLVGVLSDQGLMYSLLSKMNYDQQQEVFKDYSDSILVNILNNSFWRKYFLPATLHVLDIMQPSSYFIILHGVARRMAHYEGTNSYLRDEYKYAFKLLWEEGASTFIELVEGGRIQCFHNLLMTLSWEFDIDILILMFNSLKRQGKKHLVFSDYNILDRWFNYVENGRLDLLEQFLRAIFSSEGEIRYFKSEIGCHIAVKLAKTILDDETDRILDWHFESEKKKEDVRMQILCFKRYFLEASMLDNNKVDFAQFENDLKWCAKGDLNEINGLKDEFASSLFSVHEIHVLRQLIRDDKYEILNQFLNYCFSDDQVKLAQFKSATSKELSSSIHRLAVDLFVEDSPTMADKFMEWLLTNGQEVQEYKTWLLTPASDSCNKESVCTSFLIKNQFELADKVVKWCVTSDEEIAKFKRKLMMSNEVFRNCRSSEIRPHNYNLPLLINWFNPSKDLIEDFKRHVPENECPINFYELLDDFLKNQF